MDALHGLSALASQMPRAQSTEEPDRSSQGQGQARINPQAPLCAHNNRSLPPRKRQYDLVSSTAATVAAAATSSATASAALVDEASIIELELARRRLSTSAYTGMSATSVTLPQLYQDQASYADATATSINRTMGYSDAAAELEYLLVTQSANAIAKAMVTQAMAAKPPQAQAKVLGDGHFGNPHRDFNNASSRQLQDLQQLQQLQQYQALAGTSVNISPRPIRTSSSTVDVFAEARAAEARAQALYQPERNLQQERIFQEALYQQQEQMLLSQQQRQQNVDAKAAAAAGLQQMLPNGLTVEDMMAVTAMEYSKAKEPRTKECSEKESRAHEKSNHIHTDPSDVSKNGNSRPVLNSLHLPYDSKFLNEAHCLLRSVCIEPFICSNHLDDWAGKVGLRCVHCKNASQRSIGAAWYPTKLENIFDSIKQYQKGHFATCDCIPEGVKTRHKELLKRGDKPKHIRKLRRAYYAQAAAEVGLVNGPRGLEYRDNSMECHPSEEMKRILQAAEEEECRKNDAGTLYTSNETASSSSSSSSFSSDDVKHCKFISIASDSTKKVLHQAQQESTPFVSSDDFPNISDYVYLLYHQLVPCKHTESTIKRRRLNPDQLKNIPGLCCKHCRDNGISSGMYFPLNVESLGDSSFGQTLKLHISSCPGVPRDIKHALEELKDLAKRHKSFVQRGAKKAFIEKIWLRMEDYAKNEN